MRIFSWIINNLFSIKQSEILKYNSNSKSHKSSWEKLKKIIEKIWIKCSAFTELALPWNSFSHNYQQKKTWHKNRVSVFQFCRSVKKKWRLSRSFSDTRIWREKRSSKNKTSLNHRNNFKIEKTCFAHFLVFERENCNCLFHQKPNFIQIFYQVILIF